MRPPGPLEIVLIIVILIIIFGVGKLPQVTEFIGKGVGKGVSFLRGKKKDTSAPADPKPATRKKKVIRKLE